MTFAVFISNKKPSSYELMWYAPESYNKWRSCGVEAWNSLELAAGILSHITELRDRQPFLEIKCDETITNFVFFPEELKIESVRLGT